VRRRAGASERVAAEETIGTQDAAADLATWGQALWDAVDEPAGLVKRTYAFEVLACRGLAARKVERAGSGAEG